MNDDDGNHDDSVVSLDARREANKPAYSWVTDTRVLRCGKAPVKMTVAYLLNELKVNPETMQVGAAGFAIFPFKRSLLKENRMSADEYRLGVNKAMFAIINMYPEYSTLRGEDTDDATAWLIYIL